MNARSWKAVNLARLRAISTTTQGSAIDLATYANLAKREMKVAFQIQGMAGTTPSVTVAVTESDTNASGFAAPTQYTAASAQTTNGLVELNFRADKRYIRAEITLTSDTTAADVMATAFVLQREANS